MNDKTNKMQPIGDDAIRAHANAINFHKAACDHVTYANECPRCGENHVDHLVWQDTVGFADETVKCLNCCTLYIPGAAEPSHLAAANAIAAKFACVVEVDDTDPNLWSISGPGWREAHEPMEPIALAVFLVKQCGLS
jgi:hypothetical protein